MSNYTFSAKSKANLTDVDPRLIEVTTLALTLSPIDFGIPSDGGVRTSARQFELFQKKLSKADGYDKLSEHQKGRALDFYAYVNGRASWEESHLSLVAAAHLQAAIKLGYKIQWGGLWKGFIDMPHIQLIGE